MGDRMNNLWGIFNYSIRKTKIKWNIRDFYVWKKGKRGACGSGLWRMAMRWADLSAADDTAWQNQGQQRPPQLPQTFVKWGCKSDNTNVLCILLKREKGSTVHADSYLDGTRELCWVQQKPVTKDYVLEDTIALIFFKKKLETENKPEVDWSQEGSEWGCTWVTLPLTPPLQYYSMIITIMLLYQVTHAKNKCTRKITFWHLGKT